MKKLTMAMIGLGQRGSVLYDFVLGMRDYLRYYCICDNYEDRCKGIADRIENKERKRPACYVNYKKCINESKPDCVLIATSWYAHIEIAIYAMERGIPVCL